MAVHETETQKQRSREERGFRIAALVPIRRSGQSWEVPSQAVVLLLKGMYGVPPTASIACRFFLLL